MPEFVQFEASTPVVVPPTPAVTYDKYWMTGLNENSRNPLEKARLAVTWMPARDIEIDVPVLDADKKPVLDAEGNPTMTKMTIKECQPNGKEKRLVIEDLFGLAATDMEIASVMNSLMTVLKRVATERNIL